MITIDMNNITRKQFADFMRRLGADGTTEEKARITGELVEAVVEDWPYEQPMTADGYESLGLIDAMAVDEALSDAIMELSSKNSARRSTSVVSSGNP
jgi:hypothetical protein